MSALDAADRAAVQRPYDIGGVAVVLVASEDALLAPLASLLRGFPQTAPRQGAWRILLNHRPGLAPMAALPVRAEGRTPEGFKIAAGWSRRGRQLLVEDRLGVRVCERRRLIVCRSGGRPELAATTAGIAIIDAILEAEGQFLQHAALLALPPALEPLCGGPGSLLLLGDSGAGKSTSALALARGGWALGADDACVLRREARMAAAWPFPRDFKVHRVTQEMMPWLGAAVAGGVALVDEETAVPADRLDGSLSLLTPPLRSLPVRGLCWLGPRSDGAHQARRLSASDSLLRLAAEGLSVPLRRLDQASRDQFALFADLVRQAPWRFELSLGRDLDGLPAWLEACCREAVAAV